MKEKGITLKVEEIRVLQKTGTVTVLRVVKIPETGRIKNGTRSKDGSVMVAFDQSGLADWKKLYCPFGQVGDRLWCKQNYLLLNVEVMEVRVERLQEITEEDAKVSGVLWVERETSPGSGVYEPCARRELRGLWNFYNPKFKWDTNPWVFVISFKKIDK